MTGAISTSGQRWLQALHSPFEGSVVDKEPAAAIAALEASGKYREDAIGEWQALPVHLKASDRVQLIEAFAEDNFWRWLNLIGHLLVDLVEDQRFRPLLRNLVAQAKDDMAAGPLWGALGEAGAKAPAHTKLLAMDLLAEGDPGASASAGFLIGGVARQDPAWVQAWLAKAAGGGPLEQTACLYAIQACLIDKTLDRALLANIVLGLTPADDMTARAQAICLKRLHPDHPKDVEVRLLEMAARNEAQLWTSLNTASRLPLSARARRDLVDLALKSSRKQSRDIGAELLASLYKEDSAYVEAILAQLASDHFLGTYFGSHGEHILTRALRTDPDRSFALLAGWVEGKDRRAYQARDILLEVFEQEPLDLVKRMAPWDSGLLLRARLEILKGILSTSGKSKGPVQAACVAEVDAIAAKAPMDWKTALEGETDPYWRALRILGALLHPTKDVNYDRLIKNLALVPHLRDLLGTAWFEAQRAQGAKENLLLHLFHHERPTQEAVDEAIQAALNEKDPERQMGRVWHAQHLVRQRRVFEYWNDVFSRLPGKMPGVGSLRRKLKNPPQVKDALCEAEVTSALLKAFAVDIEPAIEGLESDPDLQVHLTEQLAVLEIYNPQPERSLQLASGVQSLRTDRLKSLVKAKHARQFKSAAPTFNRPLVLIINAGGILVDDHEIMDMLLGTAKAVFWVDKQTGAHVAEGWKREQDALSHEETTTTLISGILAYRTNLTDFTHPVLTVKYYANPHAKVPLAERSIEDLCRTLSPVWNAQTGVAVE